MRIASSRYAFSPATAAAFAVGVLVCLAPAGSAAAVDTLVITYPGKLTVATAGPGLKDGGNLRSVTIPGDPLAQSPATSVDGPPQGITLYTAVAGNLAFTGFLSDPGNHGLGTSYITVTDITGGKGGRPKVLKELIPLPGVDYRVRTGALQECRLANPGGGDLAAVKKPDGTYSLFAALSCNECGFVEGRAVVAEFTYHPKTMTFTGPSRTYYTISDTQCQFPGRQRYVAALKFTGGGLRAVIKQDKVEPKLYRLENGELHLQKKSAPTAVYNKEAACYTSEIRRFVATSADFRSWQSPPVMVILGTCSASSFYTICSKMSINAVLYVRPGLAPSRALGGKSSTTFSGRYTHLATSDSRLYIVKNSKSGARIYALNKSISSVVAPVPAFAIPGGTRSPVDLDVA